MSETEQPRLGPDLLAVMRAAVTHALARGARFVAPPDVARGLLDDARLGPVLAPFIPLEQLERAAAAAEQKVPTVTEVPEGALPGEERAPFARQDTLAFRSLDGAHALYLDTDAYHLFLEGARRAEDVYGAKHLALGCAAEAVKDRALRGLFAGDIADVSAAISAS